MEGEKRNWYDRACRGWSEDEGPPLANRYPYAVYLGLVAPVVAIAIIAVRFAQG